MRKIKRQAARFRMKKSGMEKICKKGEDGKSAFSRGWREAVGEVRRGKVTRKRKKKRFGIGRYA